MIPTQAEIEGMEKQLHSLELAPKGSFISAVIEDAVAMLEALSKTNERMAGALTRIVPQCVTIGTEIQFRMRLDYIGGEARSALSDLSAPLGDSKQVDLALFNRVLDQFECDLKSAHAEICKLQGLDPTTHSWPDWSPQANSLRWIKELRAHPPADSIEKAIGELPEDWWEIDIEKAVDKDGKPHHYLCEVRFPEDPSVMGNSLTPLSALRDAIERIPIK